ncbi:MAG: RagB/SusD family nutrient uptake outer membrane protein [Ferruginibacter sp.]
MKQKISILIPLFALVLLFSCTKLNEKFNGDLPSLASAGGTPNIDALLKGVYTSMHPTYQDQANQFALWEMTTDALIGPTRGPDWDDNGAWRVLHAHKWDGENVHLRDVFNQMLGTSFAATDLLRFDSTSSKAAEARYLRAFSNFLVLDGFDQVPYRSPGESTLLPSRVRKGTEALDNIIAELNAIMATLPDGNAANRGKANKMAAKVLLMKCYLNKGVFANRATPTFDPADMNKVISLADDIINNGGYSFATNYFDNFAPTNTSIGKENIWVQENVSGVAYGGDGNTVRSRYHTVMHYNQNPGGWNGFTTLSDFYNKFEAGDKRRGVAYPTPGAANPGNRVNVGFLIGQQYNWATDAVLQDRTGLPLAFKPAVKLIENGNDFEITGIRSFKYPIDYPNDGSGNVDNDLVFFRLSDVLLMKAEAILRGGTGTAAGSYGSTALAIVNSIRTDASRSATALASISLDQMLDERARELYLEGWRREDLIRFGKFLQPFQEKADVSDPKYLLFAIPNQQLAVNPNLTPNPGY